MSIQPLGSNSYHEKASFWEKKPCPITTKTTSQIARKALTGYAPLEKLKKPFLSDTSSFQSTPFLNQNHSMPPLSRVKKPPVPPPRSDKTQLTPSLASISAAKKSLKSSTHTQNPSAPDPSSSTSCLPVALPLFKKVDDFYAPLEKLKKPFLSDTSSFQSTPFLNQNHSMPPLSRVKKPPVPPPRSDRTQLTPSLASITAAKKSLKSSTHTQNPSTPDPSSSTSCPPVALPLFKKVDDFVVNNPIAVGLNSPSSKKEIPSPPRVPVKLHKTEELSPKDTVASLESEIQKLDELLEELSYYNNLE